MVNVGITHDYEIFTSTRTRLAFLNLRCTLWVPKLKETWQLLNIFIMVCYWNDNIVAVAELMEKFRDFKHKFAGGSIFFSTMTSSVIWGKFTVVEMLETDIGFYLVKRFHNFFFWYSKREVLLLIGFIVVVVGLKASIIWDFDDTWEPSICILQLADSCFTCCMIRELFLDLSFKASTHHSRFIVMLMVLTPIGWSCYSSLGSVWHWGRKDPLILYLLAPIGLVQQIVWWEQLDTFFHQLLALVAGNWRVHLCANVQRANQTSGLRTGLERSRSCCFVYRSELSPDFMEHYLRIFSCKYACYW